jgi:hypothetical protein
MRLVEILDTLEPSLRLSNGHDTHTAEELSLEVVYDHQDYAAEKRQGRLVIYKVRDDGVRRKAFRQVN